jgi:hypothetical protein
MSRKSLPFREQPGDEGDLFPIFGDVGLQIQFRVLAPQRSRGFELRRRARSCPARGDGVEQAPYPMPCVDQRLGLVVAGLRCVARRFRHVAIHHAFAGDEPQIALQRFLKQRVDRLRIDRAINARRGRAVADELVAEDGGNLARVGLVRKGLLRGIDIIVDPLQKLFAGRRNHLALHIVHMRVDEARRQDAAGIVGDGTIVREIVPHAVIGADSFDQPIAADDQPVRTVPAGPARNGSPVKVTIVPRSAVTEGSGKVRSLLDLVGQAWERPQCTR